MKKVLLTFLTVWAAIGMMATAVQAYTPEQEKTVGMERAERNLPDSAQPFAGRLSLQDADKAGEKAQMIIERTLEKAPQVVRSAVKTVISIFAVCALGGIASSVAENKNTKMILNLTGVSAVTMISFGSISSMMAMCETAVSEMSVFMKALMPAIAAAAAMGGAPASGTATCFGTLLFSEAYLFTAQKVIMPLVYAYIAITAANAPLGNMMLKKSGDFIKWVCSAVMKLGVTLFIGYLGVTNAVAGSADALAVKTVKFAVSGTLPVVGSVLADASETLLAGASMLKNSIGIFGLLAVLATVLWPIINIGIYNLIFKAGAAVSASVTQREIGDFAYELSDAYSVIFGAMGACAMLFGLALTVSIMFLRN